MRKVESHAGVRLPGGEGAEEGVARVDQGEQTGSSLAGGGYGGGVHYQCSGSRGDSVSGETRGVITEAVDKYTCSHWR